MGLVILNLLLWIKKRPIKPAVIRNLNSVSADIHIGAAHVAV